jgi:hypothetical protein
LVAELENLPLQAGQRCLGRKDLSPEHAQGQNGQVSDDQQPALETRFYNGELGNRQFEEILIHRIFIVNKLEFHETDDLNNSSEV